MQDSYGLSNTTFGQFVVHEMLNDNGVIGTYRATQPRLRRDVALQILLPQFRLHESFRVGLGRGAEIIASYEHANIAPVIDFGEVNDIPYIALRLARGGLLRDRLVEQPLSLNAAGALIRQIGAALDHVHTRGDVHGDPSPLNIGFDEAGNAYITDFIFAGIHSYAPGEIQGTRRYIAPERWRGESLSAASDQYALAAVAYHCLAGQSPFDGRDAQSMMYAHLHEMPHDPRQWRAETPEGVYPVLLRGLAKDARERYATIMDFARAFEQALLSKPYHVFMSYSRRDGNYARRLREHLVQSGIRIWLDDAIEHGETWFNQIHEAIKTCTAFIVIMSPDSEASEWVQKEILLARRYKKPIFPVLLHGEEFPLLIDVQFADMRGGKLPSEDFHRTLTRAIFGSG
ncbi:MAG: TIR domain-containing protein [Chloroflexota bacterium]|nr:TIR domain-containing protein [Chloroflexota bacterium]